MFNLKIENRFGEILSLTYNGNYIVTKIDGLGPPKAILNISKVAGMPGGLFNSASIEVRNIVLTVYPQVPVEKNRLELYRHFQSGEWCKIYYSNDSVDVQIEGYVETPEPDIFSKTEKIQVSIVCPQPYFEGLKEIYTDISAVVSNFEFPFSIPSSGIEFSYINYDLLAYVTNYGDVDTGVLIYLSARGEVVNPEIFSNITRGSIKLNVTLQEHDQVVINTNSGQRSIKLLRESSEIDLMNKIGKYPEWFKLRPGQNIFAYDADSGKENMSIVFRHRTKYGGV